MRSEGGKKRPPSTHATGNFAIDQSPDPSPERSPDPLCLIMARGPFIFTTLVAKLARSVSIDGSPAAGTPQNNVDDSSKFSSSEKCFFFMLSSPFGLALLHLSKARRMPVRRWRCANRNRRLAH